MLGGCSVGLGPLWEPALQLEKKKRKKKKREREEKWMEGISREEAG